MENRYKLKGTNIRVYDDLTLPNRKLLNRLKNHKEIEQAWVSNGKIKAKTVDGYRFTAEILMDIDLKCNELRKQRRTTYNANAAPRTRTNDEVFTFSEPLTPTFNRPAMTENMDTVTKGTSTAEVATAVHESTRVDTPATNTPT